MAEHDDELLYEIALIMVPGVGCVQSRLLIDHFKKASAIFHSKEKELSRVENVGPQKAKQIKSFYNFKTAEAEIKFIR
ncbi:MAG: rossmann fold nucleotide-binding protein Smf, partial [Chitinophagaceae bacterium]|nr:rossmann fold nucleotide-binding protein Smf [Chitinophagaceae bacterium]